MKMPSAHRPQTLRILWLILCCLAWNPGRCEADVLDLTQAVVVVAPGSGAREAQAAALLVEEVERRTAIRWQRRDTWPDQPTPVIALGLTDNLLAFGPEKTRDLRPPGTGPAKPESYRLVARGSASTPVVWVGGEDTRGVMFGVGRLLREMRLTRGRVGLNGDLDLTSAPAYRLRGHQLGYRPKTNSYDAWDLPQWEQYFRDLVVFGCNAIELIPPRSDDDADSPHFPRPPLEMMVKMSELADRYDLDVWVWYPAMDRNYAEARTVDSALSEWAQVFRVLPRLDAVFVPGGDPGHTQPKHLMALLARQTTNLHAVHPRAQMWVSPQGFHQAWMDEFLGILRQDRPQWLSGVVFGPQVRLPLPALREAVPTQYPIRHYPDITHTRQCQYAVPDWDVAYAVTEARECINPRPVDEAKIFAATQPLTAGFISYSEGCNDDVNKFIWSALGWDPALPVRDILTQYGRYFVGEEVGEAFGQGLLALEENWRGPLLENAKVGVTLRSFQALERKAGASAQQNWRFLQALFRAYYDAYTQRRLGFERRAEAAAMQRLRQAPRLGALQAMARAEAELGVSFVDAGGARWHRRIEELADALFATIRMQLSVHRHRAIAVDRGAALDTLDFPLNNRPWLREEFVRVRRLATEADRLAAIRRIVDWEDPGPGGYYDDLGNVGRQPHLVRELSYAEDPGNLASARCGFEEDLVVDDPGDTAGGARKVAWMDHAESLYDAPLRLRYSGLDPQAAYVVRVVYGGDNPKKRIRLVVNDQIEVHPLMTRPVPFRPLEFPLPGNATAKGELTLTWFGESGLGGNGRGCQVSEVWLERRVVRQAR